MQRVIHGIRRMSRILPITQLFSLSVIEQTNDVELPYDKALGCEQPCDKSDF